MPAVYQDLRNIDYEKGEQKKNSANVAYLIKQQIYENQCENSPEIFFQQNRTVQNNRTQKSDLPYQSVLIIKRLRDQWQRKPEVA